MRYKAGNVLWGLVFILVGIGFAGNALWSWNFTIFFDGWWTLFIIIPCGISMIQYGPRLSNAIGMCVGILLLLSARFNSHLLGDLIIPAILIIIGISFIVKPKRGGYYYDTGNRDREDDKKEYGRDGTAYGESKKNYYYEPGKSHVREASCVLSSRVIDFSNQLFEGIAVNCVLGSLTVDLRNADICDGAVIEVSTVLGGVDIYIPRDIEVRVEEVPILGGVTNPAGSSSAAAAVIYVKATCVLSGVNIQY